MITDSLRRKVVQTKNLRSRSSDYIGASLSPGYQTKVGAQGPFSKVINPEQGNNIPGRIPTGQPVVPTSIPVGAPVEESVTVVIDTTSLGLTLATQQIILFDESQYYRAKNGIASPFPAGTVYINSSSRNLYNSWVSGLCGATYVFTGVQVDVSAAAGAAANADLQFQQRIVRHQLTTRMMNSDELELKAYNDPKNFDRNIRIIPLVDQTARADRQTAWELNVYHGLVVTMTFWMVGIFRD